MCDDPDNAGMMFRWFVMWSVAKEFLEPEEVTELWYRVVGSVGTVVWELNPNDVEQLFPSLAIFARLSNVVPLGAEGRFGDPVRGCEAGVTAMLLDVISRVSVRVAEIKAEHIRAITTAVEMVVGGGAQTVVGGVGAAGGIPGISDVMGSWTSGFKGAIMREEVAKMEGMIGNVLTMLLDAIRRSRLARERWCPRDLVAGRRNCREDVAEALGFNYKY